MMQSRNTGIGRNLSSDKKHGTLETVFEAYKEDSQDAVIARTKSLAKRYATHIFGGYDLVSESKVMLSIEERQTIANGGFIQS